MSTYNISCPICGIYHFYLNTNVYMSNEEMLKEAPKFFEEAWDNGEVDCGVLHNTERIPFEDGDEYHCHSANLIGEFEIRCRIRGFYTFNVRAESEEEALKKAQRTFNRHWNDGKVDCGVLYNVDRIPFEDGNKEEYRCNDVF